MSTAGDRDRPGDLLCLSTAWTPDAPLPDGETRTSSRHEYRHRRGRAAGPDSTNTSAVSSSSSDKPPFFGHLKNIEKVCKNVDERMQKRKVQKEWSNRMISEAARLRDEADSVNMDMHGERPRCNDNADVAEVDACDNDYLGTPQADSVEEEVPTSQSQERYLSVFHFSQTGEACAPINGKNVDVAATSVMSPGEPVATASTDILSEDPGALFSSQHGEWLP